jgi:iron complex outermembrane receptor protein
MFRSFIAAAIMLLSQGVYAQFSISGSVRETKNNQPLAGATIEAEGIKQVAVTDELGHFELSKLPAAEYVLRVRFLGYSQKTENVHVDGNVTLSLQLEESFQMTDEVVVYATRADEKTPATYTNITKQAIQKQNFGQDLPMILNWTPSLVTTSDAGTGVGYTGIRIRGSDATRVNVTVNGIPYNDSESQGTYWVDIPDVASSTQSIQIQRGVGTSTNGAGAFGASINLQTNTRNDVAYGSLVNSFGSFKTHRHTLGFGTGLIDNRWILDGRISKIASDGYIDRATSDLQSYYLSGGFYAGKTIIKAILFGGKERTYQAWYGVPESRLKNDAEGMEATTIDEGWNETQHQNLLNSNSRTFNPYTYKNQVDDYRQDNYQLHFSHRFGDFITASVALHYTKGKGYYEEYRYNDKFSNYGLADVTIGDSVITSSDLIRRRWLDNDFYGTTYSLNYDKGKLNATLGGAWNRYTGNHFGEIIWAQVTEVPHEYRYYFNTGDKRDFNIFGKATYDVVENLSIFLDLQWRRITYSGNGKENKQNEFDIKNDFNFFNPKAGITYSLENNQQIYASYSIGNREPVRDDFVDALVGTNKTPKPERLRNLEVGFRKASERFILNVNYYLMSYKNQLVLTGKLNDVGAALRTNAAKSYRTGIEIEGTVKLSNKFRWNANLTLSKNKIRDFTEILYDYGVNWDEYNVVERKYTNSDISFSPNIIAGSAFTYQPFTNAEITLLTKYVGKQYLDNTSNEIRSINEYLVNDIRIGYSWKPSFIKEISFSLLLNNLLNEKYASNGYTWGYLGGGAEARQNYYYPQAGRNFLAMISLKF